MIACAQLAERGDAPALLDDAAERWLDYRSLARAVADAAGRLIELHERPLVFLFSGITVAGSIAYLAGLEAGAVIGLFGQGLPPGRADALVRLYRPHLVVGFAPEAGYAAVPGRRTGTGARPATPLPCIRTWRCCSRPRAVPAAPSWCGSAARPSTAMPRRSSPPSASRPTSAAS